MRAIVCGARLFSRAACNGFDTNWSGSAHPWPLTANLEHRVSGYYSRSRTLYLPPLHWYPVPHVGYRRSLPLVSCYSLDPLATGSILVGRDPSALPLAPGLVLVRRDPHTLARYRLWCLAIFSSLMHLVFYSLVEIRTPLPTNRENHTRRESGYFSRSRTFYMLPLNWHACSAFQPALLWS